MKYRLTILLSCLFIFCAASCLQAKNKQHKKAETINPDGPKVKVLLEKDVLSALVEAKGPYAVYRKDKGTLLSYGSVGKRFNLHAEQEGLAWGEGYPDVFQIAIVPTSPETSLYVNGWQYKGALSIYQTKNNKMIVVNEVPIEDFVKSTLALEISAPFAKEAMAAVAIAARTNVYASTKKATKKPWDLSAKEVSYFGQSVTAQSNGIDEIIDWTRFIVMEKQEGQAPEGFAISHEKAEELALKGFDAKKILQNCFPQTKLGITANLKQLAAR